MDTTALTVAATSTSPFPFQDCTINVTSVNEAKSDIETKSYSTFDSSTKPTTIITTTGATDSDDGGQESGEEDAQNNSFCRRFKEFNINDYNNKDSVSLTTTETTTASTFQLIPQKTTTTAATPAATTTASTTSAATNLITATTSKMIASRYRIRDLLLGDFAFNDDGER